MEEKRILSVIRLVYQSQHFNESLNILDIQKEDSINNDLVIMVHHNSIFQEKSVAIFQVHFIFILFCTLSAQQIQAFSRISLQPFLPIFASSALFLKTRTATSLSILTMTSTTSSPPSSLKPLLGKIAVVTGASSGIGAAIAEGLSLAGAKVGVGGRRLDRLQELAQKMNTVEGIDKVHPSQVDVTDRKQMEAFVKDCEANLGGPIDIFVNNAGVMFYGRIEAMREEQWHMEVDVNCKGLLHATACVLPGMLARGSGHIVVTSSDAGRKVFPGLSCYSASKFFVEAFCQGMRLENADKGLKVTTIQPGDCRTELSKLTTDEDARKEFAQPSQDREFWLDPQDVAGAVLYAVSAPAHVGINEVLIEPRGAPA